MRRTLVLVLTLASLSSFASVCFADQDGDGNTNVPTPGPSVDDSTRGEPVKPQINPAPYTFTCANGTTTTNQWSCQ